MFVLSTVTNMFLCNHVCTVQTDGKEPEHENGIIFSVNMRFIISSGK